MKKFLAAVCTTFLATTLLSTSTFARIGVGVGTGKIQVDEDLNPGTIYELPPVTVLNTGDEASDYEVAITYHQDQPEFRPDENWFKFSPSSFSLEPGDGQAVEVTLSLPIKTIPGDYFAYLEGHPVKKSKTEGTTIGIAAASKLYFTVAPANIFQGIYYRAVSFWKTYAPWTNIVTAVVAVFVVIVLFKKFFKLNISVGKKEKEKETKEETKDA